MQRFFLDISNKTKRGDSFTALSKSKQKAVLFCLFISSICSIGCVLAYLLPIPSFFKIIIFIAALCFPFLLTLWFDWFFAFYLKMMEKESLLKRLVQKKVSYLENIIQNSSDIIFTIDFNSYILKFNRGAEYQFGYSQEEVLGKPMAQLFRDSAEIDGLIKNVEQKGSVINEEFAMKSKNGDIKLLKLSISKMNYENININGFVVTATDITEMKNLEQELRKKNDQLELLAITDSLTDLYNVRHFYNQIKRELKRYARNPEHKLSLVLIDIDHFKELNDSEGHQMGDHVLASLAQVIKVCIRQDVDSGFRYGGDEFVIILPYTDKDQADVVARRIQKQFGAFKFGKTSLSIGITEAHINDNEETIVKRADDAMYKAKRSGKACIVFN